MARQLEFYFDCSSPWTYLAFHAVQPLAVELGADIAWKPILVGGVFNAVNRSFYAERDNLEPSKRKYLLKDIADWARKAGIKIHFPPAAFPVNSVKAMRGCLLLEAEGKLVPFARAAFETYFGENRDVSQDTVLAGVCQRIGVDPQFFFTGIARQEIKDRLRANTEELAQRGGFGSPTMFVENNDMYFGNDRLVLVRDAILRLQDRKLRPPPGLKRPSET